MPLFDIHTYYGRTPSTEGLGSVEAVQAAMERFEMDAIALVSSRARHVDFIEGNHELRSVVDGEKGIFGYVTLNPAYAEASIAEMRVYLAKHDFVGSVMFPQGGTPVLLAEVRTILNAQRRYAKPVLIYVEDRDGVRAARQIAEAFDGLRLVLLNMGGYDWRYAVDLAHAMPNVALDLSGALDADKMAHAAATVTTKRLLFGSAMPYADPNLLLGMLNEAETVSQLDRRRITYQNALHLFNIEAEVE
jgi:predicted TIM-barrel fold metal-dependent hydrolase